MNIVITGCAGFIGYHTTLFLLKKKFKIIGIDSINNYYDPNLKKNRLNILKKFNNFHFFKVDITEKNKLNNIFKKKIDIVIHLAAQAGVRYSLKAPEKYINSNLNGFFNIIEEAKIRKIKHFIFASTSSVYGYSNNFPLDESFNTDEPLTLYAATKKSNEVIAYSYSNLYNLHCTGLRFFTVYGPYGRPDMALFKFTKNIIKNKYIELFNSGNHTRDFTYIDDVVISIYKLLKKPSRKKIPYQILNICSNNPISLKNFIKIIEKNLNLKAKIKNLELQKGDVKKTHGNNLKINNYLKNYKMVNIEDGISKFIIWYKSYYKIK